MKNKYEFMESLPVAQFKYYKSLETGTVHKLAAQLRGKSSPLTFKPPFGSDPHEVARAIRERGLILKHSPLKTRNNELQGRSKSKSFRIERQRELRFIQR